MENYLRASKSSRYVTNHSGQLSLVIPLWVGTIITSKSWSVNRQRRDALALYQWSRDVRKRRSLPPNGPCGSGKKLLTFHFTIVIKYPHVCHVTTTAPTHTEL